MITSNKLSLFKGYQDICPAEETLENIVEMIRHQASVAEHTERYRYYRKQHNDKAARNEKSSCPCFAVAVRFEGGKTKNHICAETGLCLADFDHVDEDMLADCLQQIRNDPHTLLAYITIGGEGIRVISRYVPAVNDGRISPSTLYAAAFSQMNSYYAQLTGLAYDEKCKNITRLSGLAHDPDVWFRPDAEPFKVTVSVGTPRAPHKGKQRMEAVVRAIRRQLKAENIVYEAHRHNEYIMRTGYLMNAYGIPQQVATEWAVQQFADYDGDVAGIFHSCYQNTAEHATLHLKSRRSDRNEDLPVTEIMAFLQTQGRFRKNIITGKYEMAPAGSNHFEDLTDRDVNSLWRKMSTEVCQVRITDIRAVIESDFTELYNPFSAYMDSLPEWDGQTDHIAALAAQVHVSKGAELFPLFFKKWMVAMVAALTNDRVVNHEILVLVGQQGIYKSTWLNNLLPPELKRYFYLKSNSRSINKDDLLTLAEFAVVCLEELDEMNDRELNQLKALATTLHINERAAYAHYKENRPHIASLCGTGNNPHFLTDLTGNRRWMPFEVEHIDNPYKHPLDYPAIYAQAKYLSENGFRYWLEEKEIHQLNEHNRHFEVPCLERDLILTYYQVPETGEPSVFLSNAQILQRINTGLRQPLSPVRIGHVMSQLGFKPVRDGGKRGYLVKEVSDGEIESRKKSNQSPLNSPHGPLNSPRRGSL